jgi:outer membrane receptor protein involved in Fe transport
MLTSLEIGTDWRFLEGRVGFDLTYYSTVSTDQRISVTPLAGTGFTSMNINAGKITNRGLEILVDAEAVATGNFSWRTSLSYAHNRNKIVELNPNRPNERINIGSTGQDGYFSFIQAGGSFGDLYARGFVIDDATGRIRLDHENRPMVSRDPDFVGHIHPDFTLGWNNNFRYGNWSLGFQINGVFGGMVMSMTQAMNDNYGISEVSARARDRGYVEVNGIVHAPAIIVNGVIDNPEEYARHGELVNQVCPRVWYEAVGGINGIMGDYFYDRTNVRLTQFALTYNLPVRQLNLPVRSASVGLVGQNLLFLYNKAPHDPELTLGSGRGNQAVENFQLPLTRTVGFNVRVNF